MPSTGLSDRLKLMVSGLRRCALANKRVQALFTVLVLFHLQLRGFTNAELREPLAQLLGLDPANYSIGRMPYDLRRLRLHAIIERIPRSHRYLLTPAGLRIALFFSRAYTRLLRPALTDVLSPPAQVDTPIAFDRLDSAILAFAKDSKLAA